MGKVVEVKCPARISLFLNILGFDDENELFNFKMVNQTVDLYDIVTLGEFKKISGVNVTVNNEMLPKDNIYEMACNVFFNYTGITPSGFQVDIEKNISDNSGLGGQASDIAGILLGLDRYYRTNIPMKKLAILGYNLDIETPYFIKGGYCIVKNRGLDVETSIRKNPYQNYLLIEPNIDYDIEKMKDNLKNISYVQMNNPNQKIYNDYNRVMPDKLKELREILNNYQFPHSLAGNGLAYFVAYPGLFSSGIQIQLKKELPNYQIKHLQNSNKHLLLSRFEYRI